MSVPVPGPSSLPGPTAAIVIIGEEILSGKVEEENARFLVQELRSLGVSVRRIEVLIQPDAGRDPSQDAGEGRLTRHERLAA